MIYIPGDITRGMKAAVARMAARQRRDVEQARAARATAGIAPESSGGQGES